MKNLLKKYALALTPDFLKKWIVYDWRRENGLTTANHSISFSQQAEDLHIEKFFEGKNSGFYVDIGAFDPILFSNTYKFYRKGWHGINIEANPDQYQKFENVRPGDMNLNIAISDTAEELTYYRFNSPALNSFNTSHVELWINRPGYNLLDKLTIKACLLSDILDKHLPPGQVIDFMSIDVEGWDLKVLHSNNWIKYRPTLLLVEFEIDPSVILNNTSLFKYLRSKDYEIYSISGGTAFFIDRLRNTA